MRMPRLRDSNLLVLFAVTISAVMVLPACNVKVDRNSDGRDKKVDIETPIGALHVNKDADVRDTGLAVYPGAVKKEKDKGDDVDIDNNSANVNISSNLFGLRVVAVEFLSNDPPDKLVAYYRDQLKKYGSVLECHTSRSHAAATMDSDDSKELKCDGNNGGKVIELKVGTKQNQRIVSIRPADSGSGSDFGLVYIQMHGGKDTI
jgi:hypothetical protein